MSLSPTSDAARAGGASRALVLLDGACEATPLLRARVPGRRVIAADGGIRHAGPLGVRPTVWIGDFDSADAALADEWADVPRDSHPPAKDSTDGELALRAALEGGADDMLVAGALGGARLDHALGTLMLCASLSATGARVVMTDGRQWVRPLTGPGTLRVPREEGTRLSVVALAPLQGLTLEGVRWPLAGEPVPFGSSRTLSNEMVGAAAVVTLRTGLLLAVSGPCDDDALPEGHSGAHNEADPPRNR